MPCWGSTLPANRSACQNTLCLCCCTLLPHTPHSGLSCLHHCQNPIRPSEGRGAVLIKCFLGPGTGMYYLTKSTASEVMHYPHCIGEEGSGKLLACLRSHSWKWHRHTWGFIVFVFLLDLIFLKKINIIIWNLYLYMIYLLFFPLSLPLWDVGVCLFILFCF